MKKYSGVIGIFILLAASVFYTLYSEAKMIYIPFFAIGIIITLISIYLHYSLIINILKGKAVKYSTNSIIYILIIFSILAVLNFISLRNHIRFDSTESKVYSLSPQSLKVLENLSEPVHITSFFTKERGKLKKRLEKRLDLYKYHSPLIKHEFIDPIKNPGRIEEKGIDPNELGPRIDGLSLIESGGKKVKIFGISEEKITNAILESSRKERKIIYFLQGHGEKDIQDSGGKGYSKVMDALKSEYYDVENIIISADIGVPKDCTVLVIPGPEQKILDSEIRAINHFIMSGGRLLVMLDPGNRANLDGLLNEVGLKFDNNTIIDPRYNYLNDQIVPRVFTYSEHSITQGWSRKLSTVFPIASSVGWLDIRDPRLFYDDLAKTSTYSWGERNMAQIRFNPDNDMSGPLNIAALASKELEADEVVSLELEEGETREFRVVLIGDSDCFTNNYFDVQANGNFFLNIIGWLSQEENLISIRGKTLAGQSLLLSKRESLVLMYSLFALPILIIIIGITVWIRRRSL